MKLSKLDFLFVLILILAIFLRFWGLWAEDIQSDAAVNSVRALGWFDFLTGQRQTSPIIWFGEIPSWARLSFHDHPPLVFLVQYLFLNIFGESSLTTLFSFALASLGTTLLIYYLIKKIRGVPVALLSIFLFTVASYSIWNSRAGYLEGIEILFVTASFASLVLFLESGNYRYWLLWIAVTAFAILSKYTAIFLLPGALVTLLLWKREVVGQKRFWLSWGLFLLILAPLIIYNVMVYQTRGHFDAALSSMFGMNPEDYVVLTRRINAGLLSNLQSVWQTLKANESLPFFLLHLTALGYLTLEVMRRRADLLKKVLFLNLLFLVLMFGFSGVVTRFLAISLPFLSISSALAIIVLWRKLPNKRTPRLAVLGILVAIFGFELFYSINTNLLTRPFGRAGIFYARDRFYKHGWNELDRYLQQRAYGKLPKRKKITKLFDVLNYNLAGREAILFDDRADWNLRMWYIHRYQAYYDVPLVYISDVLKEIQDPAEIFPYLLRAGSTGFWFVEAVGAAIDRREFESYNRLIEGIATKLEKSQVSPTKQITNYRGETVFKVYHFYIN